jgi:hypothetical protein
LTFSGRAHIRTFSPNTPRESLLRLQRGLAFPGTPCVSPRDRGGKGRRVFPEREKPSWANLGWTICPGRRELLRTVTGSSVVRSHGRSTACGWSRGEEEEIARRGVKHCRGENNNLGYGHLWGKTRSWSTRGGQVRSAGWEVEEPR